MWTPFVVFLLALLSTTSGEILCIWFYNGLGGHLTDDHSGDCELCTSSKFGVAAAALTIDLGWVAQECERNIVLSLGNTVGKTSYESWILDYEPAFDGAALLETKATLVRGGEIEYGLSTNRTDYSNRLGTLLGANIRYKGEHIFKPYHIEKVQTETDELTLGFIGLNHNLEKDIMYLPRLSGFTLDPPAETLRSVTEEVIEAHSPDIIFVMEDQDSFLTAALPPFYKPGRLLETAKHRVHILSVKVPAPLAGSLSVTRVDWGRSSLKPVDTVAAAAADRLMIQQQSGAAAQLVTAKSSSPSQYSTPDGGGGQVVVKTPLAGYTDWIWSIAQRTQEHRLDIRYDKSEDEWCYNGTPVPFKGHFATKVKSLAREVWDAIEGSDEVLALSDEYWGYQDKDYILSALYADAVLDSAVELGEATATVAFVGSCLVTRPASLQHHNGVLTKRMFRDTFYKGSTIVAVDLTYLDLYLHAIALRDGCPSMGAGYYMVSQTAGIYGRLCHSSPNRDGDILGDDCDPFDENATYRVLVNSLAYTSLFLEKGMNPRFINIPDYDLVLKYVRKQAARNGGVLPRPAERLYYGNLDYRQATTINFKEYNFVNNVLTINVTISSQELVGGPFSVRWRLNTSTTENNSPPTRQQLNVLEIGPGKPLSFQIIVPDPPLGTQTFHMSVRTEQFGRDNLPLGGISANLDLSDLDFSGSNTEDPIEQEGVIKNSILTTTTTMMMIFLLFQ